MKITRKSSTRSVEGNENSYGIICRVSSCYFSYRTDSYASSTATVRGTGKRILISFSIERLYWAIFHTQAAICTQFFIHRLTWRKRTIRDNGSDKDPGSKFRCDYTAIQAQRAQPCKVHSRHVIKRRCSKSMILFACRQVE